MFTLIKNWWRARQQRKADKAFTDGYEYASGALLFGYKTVGELEIESDGVFDCSDQAIAFDRGVQAALDDWVAVTGLDAWGFPYHPAKAKLEMECG